MKKYYLILFSLCSLTTNAQNTIDGHEYVDLGLPSGTMWATCNVGVCKPEESGDYFAWGETEGLKNGKTDFSQGAYKYYKSTKTKDNDGFDVTIKGYTKYVTSSEASSQGYDGFSDNKKTLDAEDDAATASWGTKWRMPMATEWSELLQCCTWIWCTKNGVNGYKVTASNNNYIFLPDTGCFNPTFENGGHYWSSSIFNSEYVHYMLFFSDGLHSKRFPTDTYSFWRYCGMSVRPVSTITTNINTIQSTNSMSCKNCNKHIVNGKVVINRNGKSYNVNGAEIK